MPIPITEIKIKKNNYKIFSFIFLSIGLILFLISLFSFFSIKNKHRHYIEIDGIVVSNIKCNSENNSNSYKPMVVFTTQDNKEIKFSPSSCSSPPAFKENEVVKVLYPKYNPYESVLGRNDFQYLPVFFTGINCFIFLFLGATILFLNGKNGLRGLVAGKFIALFFILLGLIIIFLGSRHWSDDKDLQVTGIFPIAFGVFVYILERIKQKTTS